MTEKSKENDRIEQLRQKLLQQHQTIEAQHQKYSAFLDSSLDAMVQMDFEGLISGWNKQAESIFGWSVDEVLGKPLSQIIVPPSQREAHDRGLKNYLKTGKGKMINSLVEIEALHRQGHEFPVELSIALVDAPGLREFNACIRDISERKRNESYIWNQANFDTLTSLPNRNLFLYKLDKEILTCRRSGLSLALLYIDLDHFKDVNDSLGHDMGDKLLIETAGRLKKIVREIDTVCRLSGDEFTIILGSISDQLSLQQVCEKVLDSLAQPFKLDDEVVYLTASIGATLYPEDSDDAEQLQINADQAMYTAKAKGRNRFYFFTQELQQRARRKRDMINDLRIAIGEAQFEVYFQPIVDLQQGEMHKAEALLRWHHPEHGMVSPSIFIPLAEEAGLILKIGDWVFERSLEQIQQWRKLPGFDCQISINTSPLQWRDNSFSMNKWFEGLKAAGINGDAIAIEITEDLLIDASDIVTNRLLEFRDAGVQISIDDFGTGYSSLPTIKQFEIDYLKIDKSFIRNLESDSSDLALCEAIIVMAHKLGIGVIAEGVENAQQLEILKGFGCDYAQGFILAKPAPAKDFEALVGKGFLMS